MSDEDPFEELDAEPLEDEVDADVDELFTEVQVGEVDEETVWAELTEEEGAAQPTVTGEAERVADEASVHPEADADADTVVPKASYCQQCEHFSPPPGMACRNPGTDIVELVDMEHFRVRDCPVVERRSSATDDIVED
jgi:hypothetical protein